MTVLARLLIQSFLFDKVLIKSEIPYAQDYYVMTTNVVSGKPCKYY